MTTFPAPSPSFARWKITVTTRRLRRRKSGQTWLNYLIEEQTVLWWGGMGNSTEHTAYLRLKQGYEPPYSGSVELNGKVVAEQIGAQIFIDGWALVAPGDPEFAADLAGARRQRQPWRRSGLRRAMPGGNGSASLHRIRYQQADRHRPCPSFPPILSSMP